LCLPDFQYMWTFRNIHCLYRAEKPPYHPI
jgi:hypothetical protein